MVKRALQAAAVLATCGSRRPRALRFARGRPLGSGAELGPRGPRRAALESLRGATKSVGLPPVHWASLGFNWRADPASRHHGLEVFGRVELLSMLAVKLLVVVQSASTTESLFTLVATIVILTSDSGK